MKSSLVLISAFWISSAFAAETKDFDAKDLKEITIENSSGKIGIANADSAKVTVSATKNKFNDKCTLTMEKTGSKLLLKVEKKLSLSKADCDVDFEIKTPKGVDLTIGLGSGNLNIRGMEGALTFKLGSGDVSAEGTFKKVSGMDGSGDVEIKGLTEGSEVRTGSGNIKLTYANAPTKGDLELKTGSGNATVLFPKGAKVKTSFRAGSGQFTNELGDTPSASFAVSMNAGSGNLNVKTY